MMGLREHFRRMLAASRRASCCGRERGVALVSVVIMLTVISVTVTDFAYDARVDFTSAINARDDLQAHYLARSSINLSRLLLKVQEKLIDPNRKMLGGMDLQIADYAPYLVMAFNSKEGAEGIGGFLGIDTAGIRGLGVEFGTFDLQMESLDGKLNINCGGGTNPDDPAVVRLAASLAAMFQPERYNRLFEEPDARGQYADRLAMVRAMIDWADWDTALWQSTAAEDYGYNSGEDPYESKNRDYDTVDELRLVKGVDEDFMSAFGAAFSVYGDCVVNVSLASPALLTGLIIQFAANKSDPALQYRNLALLVRYVLLARDMGGGFSDVKSFVQAVENPMAQLGIAAALDNLASGGESQKPSGLPPVTGVKLDPKVGEAIAAGGSRRIWRITGAAEVGRIKKKIVAVWDTKSISMQAGRQRQGSGAFLYWREE